MKVTQNPLSNAGIEKAKASEKASPLKPGEVAPRGPTQVSGEPSVSISDQAKLMKEARELVYASPDIRADRVSDLKDKIKNGTYKVSAEAVADKLVDEHLSAGFGKNDL